MARYAYKGTFRDGDGNVVSGGTVTVYLAGTTTLASVYTAETGGTAVNSVTSGTDGSFTFYVDDTESYSGTESTFVYGHGTLFKIALGKAGYTAQTYDGIEIFPLHWRPGYGSLRVWTAQVDDAEDDLLIALPTGTSGIVIISCGVESGIWSTAKDGSVVKLSGTTNTAATNSDNYLCVYDAGSYTGIYQRLGSAYDLRIVYLYG